MIPFQFNVDIIDELEKALPSYKLITTQFVINELKGLKRSDEFKNKMVKIAENREPMSTDVKLKISKSKKNIISPKREKVCQLDLEGNLIKIWEHSKDAENDLNITKGKISAVCLGNRKTTGGFKWKYLKNYEMVKK